MKTHNVRIFHCVSCGRVSHVDLDLEAPHCCGQEMAKAAEETIRECDFEERDAGVHIDESPPTIKNETKPR